VPAGAAAGTTTLETLLGALKAQSSPSLPVRAFQDPAEQLIV
jgi:hypothetical protein